VKIFVFLYNLLDFAGLYFSLVLVSLYLFLASVGYRAPLLLYLVCAISVVLILQYNDQVAETNEDILALWQKYFQDLSNPDYKQDFDYENYDLSHIQNAIIERRCLLQ
jgi:hypothetical protein